VFELTAGGTETVLYSFTGGADGGAPDAGVVTDPEGNHYGTTVFGGASNAGTVFKLGASGTETALYSFTGGADGSQPQVGLVRDSEGNLYGTTEIGGTSGAGVVFKVDTGGQETVRIHWGSGRGIPQGKPDQGLKGQLYGTTAGGGPSNHGVVFKVDTSGTETVLHNSAGRAGARNPAAGLVLDSKGTLYGTAVYGGTSTE